MKSSMSGKKSICLQTLRVTRAVGPGSGSKLLAGPLRIDCAIGPAGILRRKREGDGGTPAGCFRLLFGYFRAERQLRPITRLPMKALRRDDGWCDDPCAPAYNRPVRLPTRAGHEELWRGDHLYNCIVVLDHNRLPRVRGHGSAIFFHIARPDFAPSTGCVAISADAMRRLLPRLSSRTTMQIG